MSLRVWVALFVSPLVAVVIARYVLHWSMINSAAMYAIAPLVPLYFIAAYVLVFCPIQIWLKRKRYQTPVGYLIAGSLSGAAPAFLIGPPWSVGVHGISLQGAESGLVAGGIFWLIAVWRCGTRPIDAV